MPVSRPDPRFLAALLLTSVVKDGKELDAAFTSEKALDRLDPRDKSFVRHLVSTTLRHYGELQSILALYLKHIPKEAPLISCLSLGAAQLIYLDTPAHAAVDTSVSLCRKLGFVRQSGMVNAVLKKIALAVVGYRGPERAAENFPEWMRRLLVADYGEAQMHEIARAQRAVPPLDLSVKENATEWVEKLGGVLLPTGSIRLQNAGDIRELAGYDEGAFWVQDAAAALPVQLLGDVRHQRVLDLCAAPGGKTLQLAAAGAQVTALDRSARRLERLSENLARTQLAAEIICADALIYRTETPFDAVLLDAPCTATGTLRRHPDVAIHRAAQDVADMADLQSRLLDAAADLVKPGGKLVYSVCSLFKAEGQAQAAAFEARHTHAERLMVTLPGLAETAFDEHGGIRTLPSDWPEQGGMDGFFMIGWTL